VARRSAIEASVKVALDRGSGVPLHRQLYEGLREAVLSGRLPAERGCRRTGRHPQRGLLGFFDPRRREAESDRLAKALPSTADG
jgi:hypothetical protein